MTYHQTKQQFEPITYSWQEQLRKGLSRGLAYAMICGGTAGGLHQVKLHQNQVGQRPITETATAPHNITLPNGDVYTTNGYILHPNGDWNLPPAGFRLPQP